MLRSYRLSSGFYLFRFISYFLSMWMVLVRFFPLLDSWHGTYIWLKLILIYYLLLSRAQLYACVGFDIRGEKERNVMSFRLRKVANTIHRERFSTLGSVHTNSDGLYLEESVHFCCYVTNLQCFGA